MASNQWSIPLDRLVAGPKVSMEAAARKVTLDVFRKVTLRSPVDTGRFRANWNVSYGTPNTTTTTSTNASRADVETAKALTLPLGGVQYMSNGLPYAERLEYGWSKQAPSGMIRVTFAEFASIAARATK